MSSSQMSSMDDRGPGYLGYTCFCLAICTFVVGLRFWSRSLLQGPGRFWWDDWFALATLSILVGGTVYDYYLFKYGFGKHIWTLTPYEIEHQLKTTYAGWCFVQLGNYFPKESALFFYKRVFDGNGNKSFTRALLVMHVICTGWIIGTVFSTIFECIPIESNWNLSVEGRCIDTFAWGVSTATLDFVLDLVILLLPMPVIYNLHMSRHKKLLTALVVFFGYCAAAVSLVRLILVVRSPLNSSTDASWDQVPLFYINISEYTVSLLSVCFPAIFQLYRRIHESGFTSIFTTRHYSQRPLQKESNSYKLSDAPPNTAGKQMLVKNSFGSANYHQSLGSSVFATAERQGSAVSVPPNQVNVQTVIEVV